MSGAAWLAARLAGYLGGWQTLLDSDCVCIPVCVCVRVCDFVASLCAHARSLYMTSGACPPSLFLLAQKRATKATTCSPRSKKELPERRGVFTPTPNPQWSPLSQPCTQPFSLSSPGGSQQSMGDTVHDCSHCRHLKKEKSFPLLSFYSWRRATHWPPADTLSPLLLFSSRLWSCNDAAGCVWAFCFFSKLHPCYFYSHWLLVSCVSK